MINVGDLLAVLKLRDEMTPALEGAMGGLGRFNGVLGASTYQVTLFGRGVRQLGAFLTGAVTTPLIGAAAAAIKFGGDFEEVTTRLVTLANVSENDLERVKAKILEMAPAVGIGPVALAEAMYTVSSRIDDTTVSLQILEMAAKASAVGMGDVKVVAGAITTIINSYGKENITASRAVDVMAMAIKRGGAEAKDLAPTLANVVPFAARLGVSFEEVAANLATITSVGVPTSEAVTMLTSVFAGLTRETNQGKAALEGVAITNKSTALTYAQLREEIKTKGLAQALIDINERFKDNQAGLFKLFGRLEAYKNITAATVSQQKEYLKNLEETKNAQGTLDKMYDKASGTFSHMWKQVVVELEVVATELGTALLPIVKDALKIIKDDFVPVLKDFVQGFKDMPPWLQKATIGILGFSALFGPALFVMGQFIMALGNIARALGFLTVGEAAGGISSLKWFAGVSWTGVASSLGVLALAIGSVWAAWKIGNREDVKSAVASWIMASPDPISVFARWAAGIKEVGWEEAWMSTHATSAAVSTANLTKGITAGLAPMASHTKFTEESVKMMVSHGAAIADVTVKSQTLLERVAALTDAQKNQILVDKAHGMNIKQISADTKISADVIGVFLRQMGMTTSAANKAAADMKPFNNAMEELNSASVTYQDTLAGMNGDIVAAVEWYLKAGVSQNSLAVAYELTDVQVRAVAKSIEEEARVQKEANTAAKEYQEAWDSLNAIGVDLDDTLKGLTADTIAFIKAKLDGGATIEVLAKAMSLEAVQIKAIKEQLDRETKAAKEAEKASLEYADAWIELMSVGADHQSTLKGVNEETIKFIQEMKKAGASVSTLAKAFPELTEMQIKAAIAAMKELRDQLSGLSSALNELSGLTSGQFSETVKWLSDLISAFEKVDVGLENVKDGFDGLSAEGGNVVASLAKMATGLIQLANAFLQATSTGTAFQRTMAGASLGAQIGGAFGGWGAAIGAGVGGLLGFLRTPDPAKEANKNADKEIVALQKQLLDTYKTLDAIKVAGGAAGEALVAAWGSRGTAGLAQFNLLLGNFNKSIEDSKTEIEEMGRLSDELGDKVSELASLQDLFASDGLPKWNDMKEAAEKYGVSLDSLGPRYQQMAANATTQDIINAFDTLTKGGADVGTVLFGMKDEISKIVQDSKKFGTEIPANMQPWIKNLFDTGQLLDAQGNAITDISDLKFGPAQISQYEAMQIKIAEVTQQIRDLELELETKMVDAITRGAAGIQDRLDAVNWEQFRDRGVAAMQAIEAAATGAAWGHSPTGIKEINVVSQEAGQSLKTLGKIAYETFSSIEETSAYWAHNAIASFDGLGSMLQDLSQELEDLVATPLQKELNAIDRNMQKQLQDASKFSDDPRYNDLVAMITKASDIKGSQAVMEARKKEIEDAKKAAKDDEKKLKVMEQIKFILAQLERNKPPEQKPVYTPTFLNIPNFDGGGFMPNDGLAYLHAGERVLTPSQSSGSGRDEVIEVTVPVQVEGVQLMKVIHRTIRRHRVR